MQSRKSAASKPCVLLCEGNHNVKWAWSIYHEKPSCQCRALYYFSYFFEQFSKLTDGLLLESYQNVRYTLKIFKYLPFSLNNFNFKHKVWPKCARSKPGTWLRHASMRNSAQQNYITQVEQFYLPWQFHGPGTKLCTIFYMEYVLSWKTN